MQLFGGRRSNRPPTSCHRCRPLCRRPAYRLHRSRWIRHTRTARVRGVLTAQSGRCGRSHAPRQDHHHFASASERNASPESWSQQKPGTPTGQQLACGGVRGLFPARTSSLRFRDIPCAGLEDRIVEIGQLFGQLLSRHTKLVVRHVGTFRILLHRPGPARGRHELDGHGGTSQCSHRAQGDRWRCALSHRREAGRELGSAELMRGALRKAMPLSRRSKPLYSHFDRPPATAGRKYVAAGMPCQ